MDAGGLKRGVVELGQRSLHRCERLAGRKHGWQPLSSAVAKKQSVNTLLALPLFNPLTGLTPTAVTERVVGGVREWHRKLRRQAGAPDDGATRVVTLDML